MTLRVRLSPSMPLRGHGLLLGSFADRTIDIFDIVSTHDINSTLSAIDPLGARLTAGFRIVGIQTDQPLLSEDVLRSLRRQLLPKRGAQREFAVFGPDGCVTVYTRTDSSAQITLSRDPPAAPRVKRCDVALDLCVVISAADCCQCQSGRRSNCFSVLASAVEAAVTRALAGSCVVVHGAEQVHLCLDPSIAPISDAVRVRGRLDGRIFCSPSQGELAVCAVLQRDILDSCLERLTVAAARLPPGADGCPLRMLTARQLRLPRRVFYSLAGGTVLCEYACDGETMVEVLAAASDYVPATALPPAAQFESSETLIGAATSTLTEEKEQERPKQQPKSMRERLHVLMNTEVLQALALVAVLVALAIKVLK